MGKNSRKYDVFISYRRESGAETAKHLRDVLSARGYRVFFDTDSLGRGDFNLELIEIIKNCKDFILVLTPGALDRCQNPDDWVRQELACALAEGKNVIPLIVKNAVFPEKEELPEDIRRVAKMNGVKADLYFFDAMVDKLCTFLESKPERPMLPVALAALAVILILAAAGYMVLTRKSDTVAKGKYGVSLVWELRSDGELRISGSGKMPDVSDADLGNRPWITASKDSGCDITKLVVEDGITGIGERSFARMKDLEEIELADSITEIGGSVFSDCNSKVKKVKLPASLETLGMYAFNLTGNIESFTIADSNPHFLTEDGVLYNKEKTILYYYPIAKKAESFTVPSSVLEIMPSAFNNAQNLKKAELPDGLGKIWHHAFAGCKNLEELTIPESVTVIGNYFLNGAGPDNTVSLYFDGKPAEIMERAFSNVNVTAAVPAGLWAEGDMQQYGGNVKWVEK